MDSKDRKRRILPGRFSFLSIGWWILHIILIILVFLLITRIF